MKYFRDLWNITTAYLVGSFALIQFANIALPYFEVEAILGLNSVLFMRLLFIGLPIGLPIVLVVGYVLNKKAKEIKLTNIFDAVDEKVKTVQCKKESKKGCNGKSTKCLTHNLWDELENHINNFFEEKSLDDLVKNNSERRI